MKEKVFIFGTGKTAYEFIYSCENKVEILGFIDNNQEATSPIKDLQVKTLAESEIEERRIIICSSYPSYLEISKQLRACGLSEWKDYVYYKFFDKKSIVIIGNCHIEIIKQMLMLNPEFRKRYGLFDIPPVFEITEERESDYNNAIECADVIIQQDIQNNNSIGYIFSFEYVGNKIKSGCQHLKMLNTYGLGRIYYPFFEDYNEKNKGWKTNPYGLFPIKDLRIEEYLNEKKNPLCICEKIEKNRCDEIRRNRDILLEKYKKREQFCHIKIMDYFEKNYKKKLLFYDRAHPTNDVMAYMVEQLFDYLGIPINSINYSELATMSRFSLPLYEDVVEAIELDFSYDYLSDLRRERLVSERMDLKEYIKEYIFYCK